MKEFQFLEKYQGSTKIKSTGMEKKFDEKEIKNKFF